MEQSQAQAWFDKISGLAFFHQSKHIAMSRKLFPPAPMYL